MYKYSLINIKDEFLEKGSHTNDIVAVIYYVRCLCHFISNLSHIVICSCKSSVARGGGSGKKKKKKKKARAGEVGRSKRECIIIAFASSETQLIQRTLYSKRRIARARV